MVDGSEPRPDIRYVAGCGKVQNVVDELWGWRDSVIHDHEAEEVNFSEAELEFLRIKCAAIPGGPGEEVTGSEEVVFNVVIVNDGVINTSLTVREAI